MSNCYIAMIAVMLQTTVLFYGISSYERPSRLLAHLADCILFYFWRKIPSGPAPPLS